MEEETNKNYICVRCKYGCEFENDFMKHLSSEKHKTGKRKVRSDKKDVPSEPKVNQCEKCDYKSTHIYNYKTHILNNHSTLEEKKKGFTYYCESCDYGIFSKDNYEKHLQTTKHIRKSA